MKREIANTCKVIALANPKGGVAKSFTTASLAVGLTHKGKKVLVIDNDPQGHASRCLGMKKSEYSIHDVMEKLVKKGEASILKKTLGREKGVGRRRAAKDGE